MNCHDVEQLTDAHLDGQLAGALRLEFEAHRLRCRRCHQALTILESTGRVIASDSRGLSLSDDFTDRVMAEVAARRIVRRRVLNRWTIAASVVLQAAAVIALVLLFAPPRGAAEPRTLPLNQDGLIDPLSIAGTQGMLDEARERVDAVEAARAQVVATVADRVFAALNRGETLPQTWIEAAQYLDVQLPEGLASERDPFTLLLDRVLPLSQIAPAEPREVGERTSL